MLFGYTNLSAALDAVDEDVRHLRALGCDEIIIEAGVGPGGSRPMFNRLATAVAEGDKIAITDLNRIAPSAREAMVLIMAVLQKGAGLRVLDAELEVFGPGAQHVLKLLEALLRVSARMEARPVGAGRGVGRPRALLPQDAPRVAALLQHHEAHVPAVARDLGVSVATVYRFLRSRPLAEIGGHVPRRARRTGRRVAARAEARQ